MNPVIPPPAAIGLALLAAAAQIWYWRRTALRGLPRIGVLLARLAAIGLLAWIVAGPRMPLLDPSRARWPVVLTDVSASMDFPGRGGTRAQEAEAVVTLLQDRSAKGALTRFLSFGSRLVEGPDEDPAAVRGASLPATALRGILASGTTMPPPRSMLLVSDGAAQDEADLPAVARACRDRGVPVSVLCTGSGVTVRNAVLAAVDAPRRARAGTKVPITVTARRLGIASPLVVELLDDRDQVLEAITLAQDAAEQAGTLHATTGPAGFTGSVRIVPVDGEITLADNAGPLRIGLDDPTTRVLYMEGTTRSPEPLFLCRALAEEGDFEIDLLCPRDGSNGNVLAAFPWQEGTAFKPDASRGYPATKEELDRYDVVICSDIPQAAFTPEQIRWTVDLVAERGGGFLMVGGNTSFGAGKWDRTPWEKLIPLDMDDASRGLMKEPFSPHWTDAGKRHPILADLPLGEGEKLDEILAAHPEFFGTNFIRRAKPAATVIVRMNDAEGPPMVAAEPFGKGRTMAFASDITSAWGDYHCRYWGPPGGLRDASGFNNAYYRRFWRHAIRWLGAHSVRTRGPEFELTTPDLEWPRGRSLQLFAAGPDRSQMARLAELPCTVQVRGMPGTRMRLTWDGASARFTGLMPRPVGLAEETVIEAVARDPLTRTSLTATLTVSVPRDDPEYAAPSARPELLATLAAESGGTVLRSPAEAAAWLAGEERSAVGADSVGWKPAWDRTWLLTLILGLLAADWAVRRLAS